ncbi:MAG TPA: hypothetical protein PKY82_02640, partial [Pyrinomonadaceae bacterium]|nr:hypothetical protein [Pyrinomonadaceae bacterium]
KKAGLILGIIAIGTGIGSALTAGATKASIIQNITGDTSKSRGGNFGLTSSILAGVGAIANNFSQKNSDLTPEQRRRRDIDAAVNYNLIKRLLKKPDCAKYIQGNSSENVVDAFYKINISYGGTGQTLLGGQINHNAVADTDGLGKGGNAHIFLNDQYYDKAGLVGNWTPRSTMNTLNARTMVLLHELRHAMTGIGHPDTGNPTVDEADPESNTNWNKNIAKKCFGVTFN